MGVIAIPGAAFAADPPPSVDAAAPTFVLRPDTGFVDDPFAIEPDGGKLAVLRTDSASFARLEIVDLAARRTTQMIELGDPQPVFERVWFAGRDRGVIVVVRDARDGRRTAQYYDPAGKPAGLAGPATDFGMTMRGGKPLLVGWDKKKGPSGDTTFTLTQYQADGLGRVGRPRVYVATKAGELRKPPFVITGWQDGYSQIAGQRPGGYDAKKDVRQPDEAAILDALRGEFSWSAGNGDLFGWAALGELRRKHENRSLFAVLAEDGSNFDFADGQGRRFPIKLPVPLQMYDARSLQDQEDTAAGTVYFSLALDPLNPEALARRKADRPLLDVYAAWVPAGTSREGALPTITRLVRATLDDRPVSWVASSRFVVLLRKYKNFSRGGNELEIYALK